MNRMFKFAMGLAVCGVVAVGCNKMNHDMHDHSTTMKSMMQNAGKVATAELKPSKNATTQPTNGRG